MVHFSSADGQQEEENNMSVLIMKVKLGYFVQRRCGCQENKEISFNSYTSWLVCILSLMTHG